MTDIRGERPEDIDLIREITVAAFEGTEHGSGTEAQIVDALRSAGALTVSLVAVRGNEVIGHVAFSPVTIDAVDNGWYGLGPVSVRPDQQRSGVGKVLIESGLARLRDIGALGCVVLGDPRYYARFGFESDSRLSYADVPGEYFQRVVFKGLPPIGKAAFHASFDVA